MLKLVNWLYAHGLASKSPLTAWVRHFSNCLLEKLGGIEYSSGCKVQSKQRLLLMFWSFPKQSTKLVVLPALLLIVSLLQKYLKDCFLALEDSLLVHGYVRS